MVTAVVASRRFRPRSRPGDQVPLELFPLFFGPSFFPPFGGRLHYYDLC